jgi:hypothetical protein
MSTLPPILDDLDHAEPEESTLLLRYFYADIDAQLAAAQLRQADIPSFITSSNSQTILPMGQGWIGLHVHESQARAAIEVLKEADLWEEAAPTLPSDTWKQIIRTVLILLLLIFGRILLGLLGII